jgi:hypothetical protein
VGLRHLGIPGLRLQTPGAGTPQAHDPARQCLRELGWLFDARRAGRHTLPKPAVSGQTAPSAAFPDSKPAGVRLKPILLVGAGSALRRCSAIQSVLSVGDSMQPTLVSRELWWWIVRLPAREARLGDLVVAKIGRWIVSVSSFAGETVEYKTANCGSMACRSRGQRMLRRLRIAPGTLWVTGYVCWATTAARRR